MKWFVCSDIHSFYDEWMDALEEKVFDINNKEHHIILCGDLLDRGTQPRECLRFVNRLIKEDRIICILGNHEELMYELITHRWPGEHDYHNGTKQTVDYLIEDEQELLQFPQKCILMKEDDDWTNYYSECLKHLYYETEHYIFVHSWLPYDWNTRKVLPDWRDIKNHWVFVDWMESAIWANPFLMWAQNDRQGVEGKTVVCGHWHTSWAWKNYRGYDKEYLSQIETMWMDSEGIIHPTVCYDIFEDNGIIGLDACTVLSHKVNVLVLDNL